MVPTDQRKRIGSTLKMYRDVKSLTAYRVAKEGGIKINQVLAVESGATNYTIDSLIGYCNGCGINIEFLPF